MTSEDIIFHAGLLVFFFAALALERHLTIKLLKKERRGWPLTK